VAIMDHPALIPEGAAQQQHPDLSPPCHVERRQSIRSRVEHRWRAAEQLPDTTSASD
jgi:hypothetical protein